MEGDSNSWASDLDAADGDYGSDYSETEHSIRTGMAATPTAAAAAATTTFLAAASGAGAGLHHQQLHHHQQQQGRPSTKANKGAVRKAVNRGRWTKEEVKKKKNLPALFPIVFYPPYPTPPPIFWNTTLWVFNVLFPV